MSTHHLSRTAVALYGFVRATAREDMTWESNQKAAADALGIHQAYVSRLLAQLVDLRLLAPDREGGYARYYRIVPVREREPQRITYPRTA